MKILHRPAPQQRAWPLGLAACFALLSFASSAAATPPDIYGFGPRAMGMAGAVTADTAGPSANYYNPAGLVADDALRIGVWYFSSHPFLRINGERSSVERHGAINVGLVAPVTFGDLRFAFGLGLHLPDQRIARTRSAVVDRPRWELYDTRSHRLYLATNLAFRPTKWLGLGVGIAFQSPSVLTLELSGEANALQPETRSFLEHQFRGDLTSVRYIQAGIQLNPHPRVDIGFTYRSAYELTNRIIAIAHADITGLGRIPLDFRLDTLSTSLYGPHQLSLGISVRPTDTLRLNAELTYYRYSRHPSLIALQQITLSAEIPEGLPVTLPEEIYSLPPVELGLRDTWVPRIGVEWTALRSTALQMQVRGGYVFETTPFPLQTGVTNFVDNSKHTFSLGLGLALTDLEPTLPGELRFDLYLNYSQLVSREHQKTSLVDPVGDYTSSGRLLAFGLGMEIVFE